MTNREAIENLEGCIVSEDWRDGKPTGYVTCDLTREILSMAIAALEKQEPKESGKHVTDKETWFCPRCYVAYKNAQPSYCPRCGQKLKWETWQYQIEF